MSSFWLESIVIISIGIWSLIIVELICVICPWRTTMEFLLSSIIRLHQFLLLNVQLMNLLFCLFYQRFCRLYIITKNSKSEKLFFKISLHRRIGKIVFYGLVRTSSSNFFFNYNFFFIFRGIWRVPISTGAMIILFKISLAIRRSSSWMSSIAIQIFFSFFILMSMVSMMMPMMTLATMDRTFISLVCLMLLKKYIS